MPPFVQLMGTPGEIDVLDVGQNMQRVALAPEAKAGATGGVAALTKTVSQLSDTVNGLITTVSEVPDVSSIAGDVSLLTNRVTVLELSNWTYSSGSIIWGGITIDAAGAISSTQGIVCLGLYAVLVSATTLEASGGDVTIAAGYGPVIRSPNGTKYRIKVANDGTLSTEVVA